MVINFLDSSFLQSSLFISNPVSFQKFYDCWIGGKDKETINSHASAIKWGYNRQA